MSPWQHVSYPDPDTMNRAMAKTKGQLLLMANGAGFMGSLLCDHELVWDETCETAWCDGARIGFNPKFFWWLTPTSRITVLAHELWHTGYDHMSRIDGRDPDDWNIAADHVINLLLESWGYDFSQLDSIHPCKDPQFANMTTEQIYDLIHVQMPPMGGQGGQQPANDPSLGPASPTNPYPRQPGDPTPKGLKGDLRKPASPDKQVEVKEKVVKAIQVAKMSNEAGQIPGEITQVIEEFLNPVLPWEVLLERFYTELSKDDYSWKRPSRRYEDEYLPSMDGDNGLDHLVYFLDISGSVTDSQILRFFSEVKYIHETHRPKRITMITFDTQLHDFFELAPDDPFDKFEITGRGGTCFKPIHEYLMKHRPTAGIIFTDLGAQYMEDTPGVPVLWAVSNGHGRKAPYGKQIDIKDE